MQDLEYRVVPFIGHIRGGYFSQENATTVANELEKLINEGSRNGWEFYRIDPVQIQVNPGCLGGLMGQKEAYIRFDQLIFRRQKGTAR
jgi:hypothetical protein